MYFWQINKRKNIFLYAGDIPERVEYDQYGLIGLSLSKRDSRHIKHDITKPYPISNETIDAYQAEDVFEHIQYELLVGVIDEIYRILKPGGYFRLSVPDYRCEIIKRRCIKNDSGEICFDPEGGGVYANNVVIDGGHVWFPKYETVLELISCSKFCDWRFYHYYNEKGESITNEIDYSKGYVIRAPDHDRRVMNPYRAMSIVVDMYK